MCNGRLLISYGDCNAKFHMRIVTVHDTCIKHAQLCHVHVVEGKYASRT